MESRGYPHQRSSLASLRASSNPFSSVEAASCARTSSVVQSFTVSSLSALNSCPLVSLDEMPAEAFSQNVPPNIVFGGDGGFRTGNVHAGSSEVVRANSPETAASGFMSCKVFYVPPAPKLLRVGAARESPRRVAIVPELELKLLGAVDNQLQGHPGRNRRVQRRTSASTCKDSAAMRDRSTIGRISFSSSSPTSTKLFTADQRQRQRWQGQPAMARPFSGGL